MLPLIDGDIIRYRIGWACEYDVYTDVDTGQEFRGIKAYKDWLKESEKAIEDVDFTVDHVLDPIENCLHSVKHTIDFIRRRCKSKKYVIYLTGKNNFREKLATIKKYKGNRPDLKPTHYKDITDYLINVHGAIVIDGMEADDAMAIYQSAMPNTCIVSTDKDLKQIPGWHFNFVNDEFVKVEEFEGLKFLYQQILTGDATDNIQGIPGVGEKGAQKALEGCETEEDLLRVVKDMYIEKIGKGWQDVLTETANLVYMLRYEGDKWEMK